MLNNLKSVTLFPIFFLKKIFIIFFVSAGRYAAGRGSHSLAIFSGKAGIGGMKSPPLCGALLL